MDSSLLNSFRNSLAICIQIRRPILIHGVTGAGKSTMVDLIRSKLGFDIQVNIPATEDSVEFTGARVPTPESYKKLPPDWALSLRGKKIVHFLDEIFQAKASMFDALQHYILTGHMCGVDLRNVSIVLAGNPPDIVGGHGQDLTHAFANRLSFLEYGKEESDESFFSYLLGVDDGWNPPIVQEGWKGNREYWAPLVAQFLKVKRQFTNCQPKVGDTVANYSTQRSWDAFVDILAAIDATDLSGGDKESLRIRLGNGTLTAGHASEFLTYVKNLDLPNPEDVLKDVKKFDISKYRLDQKYAICSSVIRYATNNLNEKNWLSAWKLLDKFVKGGHADIAAVQARYLASKEAKAAEKARAEGKPYKELPDTDEILSLLPLMSRISQV